MRPDRQVAGFILQQISNMSNKYLTKIYQMCYNKNGRAIKLMIRRLIK